MCSEAPAWERLISHTPATHEHISLIKTVFSDPNQVKTVRRLSGDDAQTFVNVIDEVSPRKISSLMGKLVQTSTFIDQVLDSLPQDIHRKCLDCLRSVRASLALSSWYSDFSK